jgi:hypothetical protein
MNNRLDVHLHASPQQVETLRRLQEEFAQVCNAIAPLAQQTRCWNRVALHHMAYRQMRERFPNLGSQMVCNAIYAVSRTCRIIYQNPRSPFSMARVGAGRLPLVQFAPDAPVYFDRHTLSIKDDQASLYTLDGRVRFQIQLPASDLHRLSEARVREIVLVRRGAHFALTFLLRTVDTNDPKSRLSEDAVAVDLPGYIQVVQQPLPIVSAPPQPQEAP